jgi:exodeoxyribonuclease VII large subunit
MHSVHVLRSRMALPQQRVQQYIVRLHTLVRHLGSAVAARQQRIASRSQTMRHHVASGVDTKKRHYDQLVRLLHSFSPRHILKRGYSITRNSHDAIIRTAGQVKVGEELVTQVSDGTVTSVVGGKGKPQLELGL